MKLIAAVLTALLLVSLAGALGATFGAHLAPKQLVQKAPDGQTQPCPCQCPRQKRAR